MPKYYADLHCHPTFFAFNRLRNGSADGDPERFHAWNVPESDTRKMAQGVRASAYSQCDFGKCTEGRMRLLFASITPIETGFLRWTPDDGTRPPSFAREAVKLATGATAISSAMRLVRDGKWEALHEVAAVLRHGSSLRKLVASQFLNYSMDRISFMVSPEYDYWHEFNREYEFLACMDGEEQTISVAMPGPDGAPVEKEVTGRYRLPVSTAELKEVLDTGNRDIANLLTIEGAHAFTMLPGDVRADAAVILERVEALKNWPHPIFFITLAHHFDNGICGHAHSVPDAARLVMNQNPRMHTALETEDDVGRRVVRALLDLDEELQPQGGRRILLDCKHMSPQTRAQYYAEFVEPCNEAREDDSPWPEIPVIFSHVAYSGIATLDELIENQPWETDQWKAGPFNAWGINACDEDIRAVFESRGLLGLVFEQRICGMLANQRLPAEMHARFYLQQIFGMVDAIMLHDNIPEDEKIGIWDCICLGTDFDGMIDPVAAYPTALAMDEWADDLATQLDSFAHTRMIAEIGVDELMEKISWKNAYDFAMRHMPAVCGEIG